MMLSVSYHRVDLYQYLEGMATIIQLQMINLPERISSRKLALMS
jgi:hypothetical protein